MKTSCEVNSEKGENLFLGQRFFVPLCSYFFRWWFLCCPAVSFWAENDNKMKFRILMKRLSFTLKDQRLINLTINPRLYLVILIFRLSFSQFRLFCFQRNTFPWKKQQEKLSRFISRFDCSACFLLLLPKDPASTRDWEKLIQIPLDYNHNEKEEKQK